MKPPHTHEFVENQQRGYDDRDPSLHTWAMSILLLLWVALLLLWVALLLLWVALLLLRVALLLLWVRLSRVSSCGWL